jgi:peptidoglycan/LPS O-acetylase OafA/YrhL
MSQNQARALNLDILRLISALLVLTYHYGFRMGVTGDGGGVGFPEISSAAIWLDCGLLIFFAISGYVITMSAEGRSAFDFAVGRVARLWPTFVLCASITALALYYWPIPGLPAPTIPQWLAHLVINARVLGQPFLDGAYWTIAYEVMFYGWVFVFIALGWFDKYWKVIAICWLILSAANEYQLDSDVLRKILITEYSGFFVFGMALHRLRQEQSLTTSIILIASILWSTASAFIVEPGYFEMYGIHRNPVGLALMGPVAVFIVALFLKLPTFPVRPQIAMGLGSLTYPLYLLHQNIGYAAFAHFANFYNRWLIGAALIVVLLLASWLLATFFEPAARVKIKYLAHRLAGRITDGRSHLSSVRSTEVR